MRTRSILLTLFLILLAACGGSSVEVETTSTTSLLAEVTATSTPGNPLVILVLPADLPREEAELYQKTVYDLAQAHGMRYQVRNTLSKEDVLMEGESLEVVIVFSEGIDLAVLAEEAGRVQFLAVNIPGLPDMPNISTIGAEGVAIDRQAFMAGYIGAMITEDYRIGILTLNDNDGLMAEAAFANGMQFYCGLCQKAYGPWYDYPIHIEIPSDELASRHPAYADPFLNYEAPLVYVYPEIATPELLDSMAQKGLYLISEDMPMEYLQSNWVVSLKPEILPAIQAIFPELLAGNGGQRLSIPIVLDDVNTELLSAGKQRLVQETLDDLQTGFIGTGINP